MDAGEGKYNRKGQAPALGIKARALRNSVSIHIQGDSNMPEASKTIFRSRHDRNYTVVSNELLCNPNLSGKAKWILLYLLSKPADWETRVGDIVAHGTDGRNAVLSGIRELKEAGYLRKVRVACPSTGRVLRWETHVFDSPQLPQGPTGGEESATSPDDGNPPSGNPHSGNPQCGKSDTTKYGSKEKNDLKKEPTTTKQATPSGGGGSSTDSEVSFEEWSNAQKIAALIAEGGYIGEDGELHSYRVTKQLIKACIGHNQKSAEQALMSTWEFMANQRTQGMRIRSPQGVLIKALRDWQQPTEEFEALHMSSIKIEQQTREWASLAQRCGMLSHTAFAWGHWECVVKSSGKAYTLPYNALPPGMEHVTVADMKGYLEGLLEQSA